MTVQTRHLVPSTSTGALKTGALNSSLGLILWVGLIVGCGALIGALTGGDGSAWYQSLRMPRFNPPGWIFAPVWTALYALMGVAAWRVWRLGGWGNQRGPLALFLAQLGVNFAWSPIFFGAHQIDLALVDIVVLWVLIVLTIARFAKADAAAAWLLTPYLAWVTFAAVLNLAIARLN